MRVNSREGKLVTYVGAMGSGKTKRLIEIYNELVDEGVRTVIFKPDMQREGEELEYVTARDGKRAPAIIAIDLQDVAYQTSEKEAKVILIDEIQFFNEPYVVESLENIALMGVEVYVFGLDVTSENEVFGDLGSILAHSDEVYKLHTQCVSCGGVARVSSYVGDDKTDLILVGDLDEYEPLCRACYMGFDEEVNLERTIEISIQDPDTGFSFTYFTQISKLRELGYDEKSIGTQLDSLDSVLELIKKITKEEV